MMDFRLQVLYRSRQWSWKDVTDAKKLIESGIDAMSSMISGNAKTSVQPEYTLMMKPIGEHEHATYVRGGEQ